MPVNNKLSLLRVDPVNRIVASIVFRAGKNATPEVRRVTRSKRVGWRELLVVDHAPVRRLNAKGAFEMFEKTPLIVAGGLDVDEAMKGWRIRGGEDTAGIGLLFGQGEGGGMTDCPVDRAWLLDRIEWLEGEDVVGREQRARETIDMLDTDLRDAVKSALVLPDGMWLPAHVHAKVGDAMLRMDLGTERTRGQKLSPLGESLHDILNTPEA